MRKSLKVLSFLLGSLIICADLAYAEENKVDRSQFLGTRIQEWYKSIEDGNYEMVWELLHSRVKRDAVEGGRTEYVESLRKYFFPVVLTFNHKKTRTVNSKLAISMAELNIKANVKKFPNVKFPGTTICRGYIGIWEKDNWYFFGEFNCQDEEDAIKGMLQWKDIRDADK